jgi:predicted dehydrogenase
LIRKPDQYFIGGYSNRSPSTWRQSKTRAGGGMIIMNLLHHIDAVRALIGREAETVLARTTLSPEYPEIEDTASVIVDFGGIQATFVGAGSVFRGSGQRIELWNSSMRIALLPDGEIVGPKRRRVSEADFEPVPPNQSRVEAISGFALAVANGAQPAVAVADALAVQAIVTSAYVSAAEGRAVRVADVLHDAGWHDS